jgi:hypothetical protein
MLGFRGPAAVHRTHTDDVLDVAFDCTGRLAASATAGGDVALYDCTAEEMLHQWRAHQGDVYKVNRQPPHERLPLSPVIPCFRVAHNRPPPTGWCAGRYSSTRPEPAC